jgi:hypothetical protein
VYVFFIGANQGRDQNNKMTTSKKITLASFKSFVRKNAGRVMVQVRSRFDSSDDCVRCTQEDTFTEALRSDRFDAHNLGISGIWLVLGGRDYFTPYSDEQNEGIRVWNCCGSFVLAVRKEATT